MLTAQQSPASGWNGEFEMGIGAIGGRAFDGNSLRFDTSQNTQIASGFRHLPI